MSLSVEDFARLVKALRRESRHLHGRRRYALFAVPGRGIVRVSDHTQRFVDYSDQYRPHFVGVYDSRVRAGDLQDDLNHAGVQVVESA